MTTDIRGRIVDQLTANLRKFFLVVLFLLLSFLLIFLFSKLSKNNKIDLNHTNSLPINSNFWGLTAVNIPKDRGAGWDLVKNYSGRLVTGFMMSTSATRNPDKMGDPQSPVNALPLFSEISPTQL